jgi:hypothetical protein
MGEGGMGIVYRAGDEHRREGATITPLQNHYRRKQPIIDDQLHARPPPVLARPRQTKVFESEQTLVFAASRMLLVGGSRRT